MKPSIQKQAIKVIDEIEGAMKHVMGQHNQLTHGRGRSGGVAKKPPKAKPKPSSSGGSSSGSSSSSSSGSSGADTWAMDSAKKLGFKPTGKDKTKHQEQARSFLRSKLDKKPEVVNDIAAKAAKVASAKPPKSRAEAKSMMSKAAIALKNAVGNAASKLGSAAMKAGKNLMKGLAKKVKGMVTKEMQRIFGSKKQAFRYFMLMGMLGAQGALVGTLFGAPIAGGAIVAGAAMLYQGGNSVLREILADV